MHQQYSPVQAAFICNMAVFSMTSEYAIYLAQSFSL